MRKNNWIVFELNGDKSTYKFKWKKSRFLSRFQAVDFTIKFLEKVREIEREKIIGVERWAKKRKDIKDA